MASSKEEILNFLAQNKLFRGFSQQQLLQILPLAQEVNLKTGNFIIYENEACDYFYLIKTGKLAVCRFDDTTNQYHTLVVLEEGETVGEIAILDQGPRSASVRALTPCVLLAFSMQDLKEKSAKQENFTAFSSKLTELAKEAHTVAEETFIYPRLINNLANVLGKRLRDTNDIALASLRKKLEHEKERVSFSLIIIGVVVVLSIYIMAMQILESAIHYVPSTTIVSAPLILFFSLVFINVMFRMGYPLEFYGITFKHWKSSLRDALFITPILMLLIILMKWALIHINTEYMQLPLFELGINKADIWWMLIYLVLTPFQELIVRGILQGSFEKLLLSSYGVYWAIILSNLLFSVTHFHISALFGMSAFVGGLFWGWSYAKHRTLLGVSLSHILCGLFMLYIVGFPFATV